MLAHVGAVVNQHQVAGIAAGLHAANMVNLFVSGNQTVNKLPDPPVRVYIPSIKGEDAITFATPSGPDPATRFRVFRVHLDEFTKSPFYFHF